MPDDKSTSAVPDWIHLPKEVMPLSLWDSLHDGEVVACASDLSAETVTFQVKVEHLSNGLFSLTINKVMSARADLNIRWPEYPPAASPAEALRVRLTQTVQWREQSMNWGDFAAAMATDPLQVKDAYLAQANGSVTLKLEGHLDGEKFDDLYCSVYVSGGSMTNTTESGKSLGLQEFMEPGKRYWTKFANREFE